MFLKFIPMTEKHASTIAKWRYEPPYSIYDIGDDPEAVKEMIEYPFYAVLNAADELVGFICFGATAQVPGGHQLWLYLGDDTIDVGLGVKPELTGKGFGLEFLLAGLEFAKQVFGPEYFRLSVATFNERAIRVYERAGFEPVRKFMSNTPSGEREFLLMTRKA